MTTIREHLQQQIDQLRARCDSYLNRFSAIERRLERLEDDGSSELAGEMPPEPAPPALPAVPAKPTQRELPGATIGRPRSGYDPMAVRRVFLKIKEQNPDLHDADVVDLVQGYGSPDTVRRYLRKAGVVIAARSPVSLDETEKAILVEEIRKQRLTKPTLSAAANAARDNLGLRCSNSYVYNIARAAGLE